MGARINWIRRERITWMMGRWRWMRVGITIGHWLGVVRV